MRRFRLLLVALGGLVALAAPAFGESEEVVIGMRLEPPGLDPTTGAAAAISQVTLYNIFETLTRLDNQGRVHPLLGRRWTVSEDGLTYRFDLVEGVTFHDGTSFDAADVKFSFERNQGPDSQNKLAEIFDNMTSIETPDAATVVIRLKEENGMLPYYLALASSAIVAPESAESNKTRPVGTGPYKFAGWTKGDSVWLEKYADHRNAADVPIRTATFRFINDASAQAAALLAGDIDYMPSLSAPELFAQFQSDPRFTTLVGTTEGETILAINNARPALSDIRVRRAIAHAIDRDALIQGAMFGYGTPIGSHFAPHHPAYVDLTGIYPYDPARARALLAEAGFAEGLTLELRLPPMQYARRSGELIQAMLRDVGIGVTMQSLEWPQWLDQVFQKKQYDLTIVSHVEPMDLHIYGRPDYYFQYDSPAFREILARANQARSEEERADHLKAAQRKLAEDAVNGFLFENAKLGVARAGLKGMWNNWPAFINDIGALYWSN